MFEAIDQGDWYLKFRQEKAGRAWTGELHRAKARAGQSLGHSLRYQEASRGLFSRWEMCSAAGERGWEWAPGWEIC